jgi:S-adenosylmethionine synthetase
MELGIELDSRANIDRSATEVVERKGVGHPDTLADRIAEQVSQTYAAYCLDNFGIVLHHNADKTALLGGRSAVRFGGGELVEPVIALVNGRFSAQYEGQSIPVEDIVHQAVRRVLDETLVHFDSQTDLRIMCRNNTSSSPGFVRSSGGVVAEGGTRSRWFAPRGPQDVTSADRPHSNDTSCGVGYAPKSRLEQFVLSAERLARAAGDTVVPGSVGSDVKIMATRVGARLRLVAAVPVVDATVPDLATYQEVLATVTRELTAAAAAEGYEPEVVLNARDKPEVPELYLTVTGSSIESGDEGVVGRGNRCNGLITPMRVMSIEGACGKNPVYHIGKVYNVLAERVAERLHERTGCHAAVTMVSTTGAPLSEPGFLSVVHSGPDRLSESLVKSVLDECVQQLPEIREHLIRGKIALY